MAKGTRRASARARIAELRASDLAKAAGLAIAMIVSNVVALGTTLAFGHLLSVSGYGSLASLTSAMLILAVAGNSLQAAAARQGALGALGRGPELGRTLVSWARTLAIATVVMAIVSILLRKPISHVIGVKQEWAAAAALPFACLWLLVSIQRGLLQGLGRYKAVGSSMIAEQGGRMLFGVGLVLLGAGVAGAFFGTGLAMASMSLVLFLMLRAELRPSRETHPHRLRQLVRSGWAPIAGLFLVAVFQNIDVIMAKHRLGGHDAGSYAAAAVAAKVVIWVAVGVGFHLLPEATRRHAAGEDARPVFARALGLIAVVALPALLIFLVAPKLLLGLAFGPKYKDGSDALLILGVAMSLLAATYLGVQYLVAIHRTRFLAPLGLIAVLEVVLLGTVASPTRTGISLVVLGIQVACFALVMGLAFRRERAPAVVPEPVTVPAAPEADVTTVP